MKLWLLLLTKFISIFGKLEVSQPDNELEAAVESLILDFIVRNPADIHFIANATSFDQNSLMKNVSDRELEGAFSTSNSTRKPKRNQLVVIIMQEYARDIDALINVRNVGKFYVIVLLNGGEGTATKVFDYIWNRKNILNVNVLLKSEKNSVNLLTFFPFNEENCNTTSNISIINKFVHEKWNSSEFFPNKLDFHGCTLRLGTLPAPPASNRVKHANGSSEYFGSDIKIVNELAKRFNYQNEIFFDKTWGDVFENATGIDLLGRLLDRKHDYLCGWYFLTQLKTKFFDANQPYFFVPFVVVVPPGAPYTSIENLYRAFTLTLWIAFLGSVFIMSTLIALSNKLPPSWRDTFYEKNEKFSFYMIVIIIFGDGTSLLPKRNSFRVLLMSFILTCFVLRTAYVSEMFNFLQSGGSKKSATSLEEMAAMRMTLYAPFYIELYVLLNEIKYDRRNIQVSKEMIDTGALKNLSDPNFQGAFAEPLDSIIRLSVNGTLFNFVTEPLTTMPVVIYFQKDSYLTRPFDEKIQLMLAAGLIEYWIHQEWKTKSVKIVYDNSPKVMSVSALSASFYMCLIGLAVSLIVFICEILYFKFTERKRVYDGKMRSSVISFRM